MGMIFEAIKGEVESWFSDGCSNDYEAEPAPEVSANSGGTSDEVNDPRLLEIKGIVQELVMYKEAGNQ